MRHLSIAPIRLVLSALAGCGGPIDQAQNPTNIALDVLFAVEGDHSMTEAQAALAAGLPAFLAPLDANGVDLHLGYRTRVSTTTT